jgi:hypothetical protein
MPNSSDRAQFAVCVLSEGCDDLEVWKLYRVLTDETAASEDYIRIVDNSGEDYLYPISRFVLVNFPKLIEQKLIAAGTAM